MDLQSFSRENQLSWQKQATQGNFQDYLHATKTLLTQIHDTHTHEYEPFEWVPPGFWDKPQAERKGVLLVHGLLASPNRMRDMATDYLAQGYLVRSILLTGHGLRPHALDSITKEDWLTLLAFAIAQMQHDVSAITLIGYSGGASLCLWYLLSQTAEKRKAIQQLIAIAPSLQLKNPCARLLPLLRFWPYPIKLNIATAAEAGKYSSYSHYFAFQAYALANQVNKLMQQKTLPIPCYFILVANDETVQSQVACDALLKQPNRHHKIDWYSPAPLPITDPRLTWRNSAYPNYHITDFNHLSLCSRVDNPDYGSKAYEALCLIAKSRPSFNPDYEHMIQSMLAFSHHN